MLGVVTASVKEGLSDLCAIHLAPVDARKLIRERIQEAVMQAGEIQPLTLEGPVEVEIEREEPWPAKLREGAERVDAFTVRYTGDHFWQVFHHVCYGKPDFPMPE